MINDPYKVLGVDRNATDAQIKEAYRKLAKKYHPDNYAGSPIADLASEKMKEVNEAYDQIVKERKQGAQNGGYQQSSQGYGNYNYSSNNEYPDIRRLISQNRIEDAEQLLNGVPSDRRSAEWYFLKGSVLYKKGWLEEAFRHFSTACQMDPSNMEYRAAMNQATNARRGNYGPYNGYGGYNPTYSTSSCSSCDICSSLLVADCCCECLGGDCISCC